LLAYSFANESLELTEAIALHNETGELTIQQQWSASMSLHHWESFTAHVVDSGVPVLKSTAEIVLMAMGTDYLLKITSTPVFSEFVRLGKDLANTSHHPCIHALENALKLKVFLAEASPHLQTSLTDMHFYLYNELTKEFLPRTLAEKILGSVAQLLSSGECILTPTLIPQTPGLIARVQYYKDSSCGEAFESADELEGYIGECIAERTLQQSMRVFCGAQTMSHLEWYTFVPTKTYNARPQHW
jgi:hypothetical protein